MKKIFSPRRNTNARYREAIAIDVETVGNTGEFVLAAVYGFYKDHHGKLHEVDELFYDKKQLITFIASIERRVGKKQSISIVFHNAAFDTLYLDDLIDWSTAIYSGSRLITVKTVKGSQVYDTGNFLRGSLEMLIKEFGLEKEGIYKLSLDNLAERCRMDAKATWRLFDILQRFFISEFNQSIRYTIASTALSIFQRNYFDDYWVRDIDSHDKDDFEREAYYGGRVEVYQRGEIDHCSFDVNSMYPAVMADEYLPKPNSAFWEFEPDVSLVYKRLKEGRLFVLEADMYVPYQHIPPLPAKHPDTRKLCFPVGLISGSWCSPEIAAALKYGARIVKVRRMLTYSQKKKYLAGYATDLYDRRLEAEKAGNGALKYMLKILLNSLYGKFGEKVGQTTNYVPLSEDVDLEGRRIITGPGGKEYLVIEPEEKKDTKHTFACISAFITAYARVRLLEGMKRCGEERVVYCDTDSIKVRPGKVPLDIDPKRLGAWKYEGRETARFYRPKMYGKKMKGVPNKHTVLEINEDTIRVAFEKVIKRKESIRRQLPQNAFVPSEKVLDLRDDKRRWEGNISRPLVFNPDERMGYISEGNTVVNVFPGEQYDRGNTTNTCKRGTERRKEKGA